MSVDVAKKLAHNAISAFDLQSEWLGNMQRRKKSSHQDVVDLLLKDLCVATPTAFYELLDLQYYQVIKKRLMNRYYASVLVFAWQKAVEETQPTQAAGLLRMFERSFLAHMPKAQQRLEIIGQHLAFFAVVTDNFAADGFISVAHQIVLRILGDIEKNPDNLISSVRLANYLDTRFEAYADPFGGAFC